VDRRPLKVLTDTHTLVWALSDPGRLSAKARKALAESEVTASVVNLWELCLKAEKPGSLIHNPAAWWQKYVTANGLPSLSVRVPHVLRLGTLPDLHKDPFDRILVAQAMVEKLSLVTKDSTLSRYGVDVIW
jgi:PIN domain nuclease of toxin-antitoxin system